MRQNPAVKPTPGTIGLRICTLAALLAGCGGKQCSPIPPMSPRPQPVPPPLPRTFTQTVEVFHVWGCLEGFWKVPVSLALQHLVVTGMRTDPDPLDAAVVQLPADGPVMVSDTD